MSIDLLDLIAKGGTCIAAIAALIRTLVEIANKKLELRELRNLKPLQYCSFSPEAHKLNEIRRYVRCFVGKSLSSQSTLFLQIVLTHALLLIFAVASKLYPSEALTIALLVACIISIAVLLSSAICLAFCIPDIRDFKPKIAALFCQAKHHCAKRRKRALG